MNMFQVNLINEDSLETGNLEYVKSQDLSFYFRGMFTRLEPCLCWSFFFLSCKSGNLGCMDLPVYRQRSSLKFSSELDHTIFNSLKSGMELQSCQHLQDAGDLLSYTVQLDSILFAWMYP